MSHITDKVDKLFTEWDKPDSPGCSLAVIKDGEMIYRRGYGMADLERNILSLWDQNFYHNRLGGGGDDLIQEILTPGVLNNGERLNYAFGLWVDAYKGVRTIQHAGGWAGYRSDFTQFPEQQLSVICLANLSSITPWTLTVQVAEIFLADLFAQGEQPAGKKMLEFIELTSTQIAAMTGVYYDQKHGDL